MRTAFYRLLLSTTTSMFLVISGTTQVHAAKVAVIDSGSNLPGITGIDFVRGDNVPNDESKNQHGTTISRIISTSKPVGDIIALKVVDSSFSFNQSISEAALAAAVDMPDVRVVDMSNRNPISLGALQAAADGGRVLVINAGNRARARPDGIAEFAPLLNGNAIIVGAVDPDGSIASYSNRAGDLAEYYMVAPGFTQFNETQGTSFAKPHVSGLAALLLWTFPNLSPSDAVQIILETADDLGEPGIDAVYGNGLINVQKALDPAEGEMVIPSGGDGGGSSAGVLILGAAAVGVGVAVLTKRKPLETTLVLDKYERAYTMDLTKITKVQPSHSSLGSVLKSLNVLEKTHVISQSADKTAFLRVTEPTLENSTSYNPTSWLNDDPGFTPEPSLSLYQNSANGSGYSFHINSTLTNELGALGLTSTPEDQISFLSNKIFSSPYMGYSNQGVASQMTHALTDGTSIRFGLSRMDDETRYGLRSDAAVFELSHKKERLSVSASFGHLTEYGSMFGGSTNSPYGVDDAKTYSFGFSGSYQITESMRVIGNYSHGFSNVDAADNTLLSNFSDLQSDSWAMGLVFDNIFRGRDRVGFALSQPLKVTQGYVDLTVPHSISTDNVVSSNSERVDLGSGGRELAVESFYRMWVGKRARFTTYLMHQRNPSNLSDAASANTILGIYEFQF
ncbi:S8 family serine peptidase [Gammaproteobacteria bacterium]|nr:S8 family serine peptidase [Gammaproteobacteria bacterium]